jgi:hypothetical protein
MFVSNANGRWSLATELRPITLRADATAVDDKSAIRQCPILDNSFHQHSTTASTRAMNTALRKPRFESCPGADLSLSKGVTRLSPFGGSEKTLDIGIPSQAGLSL